MHLFFTPVYKWHSLYGVKGEGTRRNQFSNWNAQQESMLKKKIYKKRSIFEVTYIPYMCRYLPCKGYIVSFCLFIFLLFCVFVLLHAVLGITVHILKRAEKTSMFMIVALINYRSIQGSPVTQHWYTIIQSLHYPHEIRMYCTCFIPDIQELASTSISITS